jgi:hypothetical protein
MKTCLQCTKPVSGKKQYCNSECMAIYWYGEPYTKTCNTCKNTFQTRRQNQTFCQWKCRITPKVKPKKLYPPKQLQCAFCSQDLAQNQRRWCSNKCRSAAYYRFKHTEKQCLWCTKSFLSRSTKLYCSKVCKAASVCNTRQHVTHCRACQKPLNAKRRVWCNILCKIAHRDSLKQSKCYQCGDITHGIRRRKWCSKRCQSAYRYRQSYREVECSTCGTMFGTRYQIKSYCSEECKNIGKRRRRENAKKDHYGVLPR